MKKRKIGLFTILGLIIVFVFLTAAANDCSDTSPSSSNTTTSSTSASSGGDINCDKDANGNPILYKQACQQVKRRYGFMNDANKYGYFYGFVQGVSNPVVEYVVQGGITSVDNRVNPGTYQEPCNSSGSGACSVVLEKQQPDGTYGTNGNAEFGWTASGIYFEWDGPYAYSEQPLSFTGQTIVGCKPGVAGC